MFHIFYQLSHQFLVWYLANNISILIFNCLLQLCCYHYIHKRVPDYFYLFIRCCFNHLWCWLHIYPPPPPLLYILLYCPQLTLPYNLEYLYLPLTLLVPVMICKIVLRIYHNCIEWCVTCTKMPWTVPYAWTSWRYMVWGPGPSTSPAGIGIDCIC